LVRLHPSPDPLLPHSSKKYQKTNKPKSNNRITYAIVAIIVVIIVAAGGYYAYATFKATSSSITTTAGSSSCVTICYAVIDTSQGTMEAQLFPTVAPKTVANFVTLADSGFYTDLVWHRIVEGFVIQTGDPTTKNGGGNEADWGQGGSNQTVPLETNASDVAKGYVNDVGYLAMARGQSNDSGSSQFFINLANNTSLNGLYTVFGNLTSGLSVAQKIGALPVNSQCSSSGDTDCQPTNPQQALVISITIKSSP
jgi:peptidyl-prolyl cis-trans isomerase B (cyclophilin B)